MKIILLLIPLALGMGFLGLMGFLWALRNGQFDDLEGSANRVLFDDDLPDVSAAPPTARVPHRHA